MNPANSDSSNAPLMDFSADSGFAPADPVLWRQQVEAELKGASFDRTLVTSLLEGVQLQPVYSAHGPGAPSGLSHHFPLTRGWRTPAGASRPWLPSTRIARPKQGGEHHTAQYALEGLIQEALSHGIQSIWLTCPADALALSPGLFSAGHQTTELQLRIDCGSDTNAALALLQHFAPGSTSQPLALVVGLDPIATLAQHPQAGASAHAGLHAESLARVIRASQAHGNARVLSVSTELYHNAGAHAVQELAYALASTVSLIRSLLSSGLSVDGILQQVVWTFAIGRDVFLEVSKLRAARLLISKLLRSLGFNSGSGASNSASSGTETASIPVIPIHAVTSRRTLTQWDPWVNMLRVTTQTFAAILGGAEVITATPFDEALGIPDTLGRRLARNTHTILREESHLDAVQDPAGGSYFVESLTEALARAAWTQFQHIEAQSHPTQSAGDEAIPATTRGMIAALLNGTIRTEVEATATLRRNRFAKRQEPITGVSEFSNPGEPRLHRQPEETGDPGDFPFPLRRDAAGFEALRDRTQAHRDQGPDADRSLQVYVSCLGTLPEHNARSTWIQNVFWAGGLGCILALDESDGDPGRLIAQHVAGFKASGARAVCLSGPDERYAAHAEALVSALKAAGAEPLLLAGRPGSLETALRAAGVTQFVFVGCDIQHTLEQLIQGLTPLPSGTAAASNGGLV